MTSVTSNLTNYMDLKEVSATLDKLKENALKKIQSINDIQDDDHENNYNQESQLGFDANIYKNYNVINPIKGTSNENVYFNNYNCSNLKTYNPFKSKASNKVQEMNNVVENDLVNMDGCFFKYEQFYKSPCSYTKQYKKSCCNDIDGALEDENGKFQDIPQDFSELHVSYDSSIKLPSMKISEILTTEFENPTKQLSEPIPAYQTDSDMEWTPHDDLLHFATNELGDICCKSTDALDLNDGTPNDISNEESEHRSGDSSNGSLSNKVRLRDIEATEEMTQKEINSIQNCTQNGVVDVNTADECESPSRRDSVLVLPKTKTVLKDKTSELGEGTRLGNSRGGSGSTEAQKVSSGLDDNVVTESETVRCEQKDRSSPKDVKRKGFHQDHNYHGDSNSKKDDCEDRHFSRINNAATTTTSNRYVRRRVEGFRGREKRFSDRCISSRFPRSESQVFIRSNYHSHAHMFPKRSKFAEDGHNFVHRRHGIDARDSRKRDRYGYGTKRRFYRGKSRDDHESTSQRSSPSAHREKPHGSRKRLKKSSSPAPREDGKKLHRKNDASDLQNSPTQDHCDGRFNRRFGGSSGLGGYSPRRRRSEAAVKTPSPPPRSPIRLKTRAWDMVPAGIDSKVVAALAAAHTAQQQQVSMAPLVPISAMTAPHKLNAAAAVAAAAASHSHLSAMLPSLLLQQQQQVQVQQQVNGISGGGGLSTVTLTQATRSIRRLYVGNVPSTVSDGELMEFMNAAMLSANAHHIPGTKPCINCIVNIEKAYAFAEFITPEDATTALGFDGVTLHGTILKIRRPKDFIAPEHGGCPIAQPAINLVADAVLDSPHKVFVGGISSSLTPDKVKEIITAFGQLKSFHWKTIHHNNGGCSIAFFEYLDPMVTHQACKGLNGMNLEGQVLTVLQATPDAKYEVFSKNTPFYDIPEEALPLLETPTNVLELHNLVSEEEVLNMQDEDIRELMEDVRIECKRFGNIRSIQIVKPSTPRVDLSTKVCKNIDHKEEKILMGTNEEPSNNEEESNNSTIAITNETCELKDMETIPQCIDNNCGDDVEDSTKKEIDNMEEIKLEDESKDVDCYTKEEIEKQPLSQISTPISSSLNSNNLLGSNTCKVSKMEFWKAGNIYVEYSRDESACHAAHALHGRGYGNAKVGVAFVSPQLYLKHFGQESVSVALHSLEDKQLLPVPMHDHLTSHVHNCNPIAP